jgi:hypothetical protein
MMPDSRWLDLVPRGEMRQRMRVAFLVGILLGIVGCFALSIAWRVLVLGA